MDNPVYRRSATKRTHPRPNNPHPLALTIIELDITPIFRWPALRDALRTLTTRRTGVSTHTPPWHEGISDERYKNHTTTSHKRCHTRAFPGLDWHRHTHLKTQDGYRYPNREHLILTAMGTGPKNHKRKLLSHGHEPDHITPATLEKSKTLRRQAALEAYTRSHIRERIQKYGEPD